MRLQLYLSPELSDKLRKTALERKMLPRELADQILKEYFGIAGGEEGDYRVVLQRVIDEIDQFLLDKNVEETFTLLDFESFRRIGRPALRSAVGRGVAKYLKGHEKVGYLRDEDGNICRTKNNHAAIYRIVHDVDGDKRN